MTPSGGSQDKTQLGLTVQAADDREYIKEHLRLPTGLDAYRLAVASAIANRLEAADENVSRTTAYSATGTVDLDGSTVRLSPGVVVPPIIVGGMADAALARAAAHADGWFTLPLTPPQIAPLVEKLAELAAEFGRPTPAVTGSMSVAIDG